MKYTNKKTKFIDKRNAINKFHNFDYFIEFIKGNDYVEYIIDVVFFLIWLTLTHITKLNGDDYIYQLIIGTKESISGLKDIFISQYNHFFMWGGRNVAHFLDQLFLMFDKIYFDIFNALIYCSTCNTIYSIRKNKEKNNYILILIYMSFWFFSGDLYRGAIWQTGSFNYLWMLFLSLLFVKTYYLCFDSGNTYKIFGLKHIFFIVISFFAGWGHEIISPVVLLAIFIYLIWKHCNKICIQKYEITGSISYFIGAVFLILSPGNFRRLRVVSTHFNNYSNNIFIKYIISIARNGYFFIINEFLLFFIAIIIVFFSYYSMSKKIRTNVSRNILFYFFILFFSVFFYFFMFGWSTANVMVQLIILDLIIVRFYYKIRILEENKILFIVTCLVSMLFIFQLSTTVYYVLKYGKQIYHGIQFVR